MDRTSDEERWRLRYRLLHAHLEELGALLGDKALPHEQRQQAGSALVECWQQLMQHVRDNPDYRHFSRM